MSDFSSLRRWKKLAERNLPFSLLGEFAGSHSWQCISNSVATHNWTNETSFFSDRRWQKNMDRDTWSSQNLCEMPSARVTKQGARAKEHTTIRTRRMLHWRCWLPLIGDLANAKLHLITPSNCVATVLEWCNYNLFFSTHKGMAQELYDAFEALGAEIPPGLDCLLFHHGEEGSLQESLRGKQNCTLCLCLHINILVLLNSIPYSFRLLLKLLDQEG